jgi:hypothetical protein
MKFDIPQIILYIVPMVFPFAGLYVLLKLTLPLLFRLRFRWPRARAERRVARYWTFSTWPTG